MKLRDVVVPSKFVVGTRGLMASPREPLPSRWLSFVTIQNLPPLCWLEVKGKVSGMLKDAHNLLLRFNYRWCGYVSPPLRFCTDPATLGTAFSHFSNCATGIDGVSNEWKINTWRANA